MIRAVLFVAGTGEEVTVLDYDQRTQTPEATSIVSKTVYYNKVLYANHVECGVSYRHVNIRKFEQLMA